MNLQLIITESINHCGYSIKTPKATSGIERGLFENLRLIRGYSIYWQFVAIGAVLYHLLIYGIDSATYEGNIVKIW